MQKLLIACIFLRTNKAIKSYHYSLLGSIVSTVASQQIVFEARCWPGPLYAH